MLFDTKLAEIERHIAYIRATCDSRRATAHPNLAERLRLLSEARSEVAPAVDEVRRDLALYRVATTPALDTWRQVFARLSTLASRTLFLRTRELPAYLAATPDDHYMSNVCETLHREVGLDDVYPVVSLHQNAWFATVGGFAHYQLYLAPASLVADPDELGLIFHEMGHTLFRLWNPDFEKTCDTWVARAMLRKIAEAQGETDPNVRQDRTRSLRAWRVQARREMEELVCDAVGTLLGGPAFVVALVLGLLTPAGNPFDYESRLYPPLDCRMRLGCLILRRRGLGGPAIARLEDGWDRVRALYQADQPRWYQWLYDDQYLSDIADATGVYLTARGLRLYAADSGGLRGELAAQAALLGDDRARDLWAAALMARLRRDYTPSSSLSSSPSQSSASSSPSSTPTSRA